MLHRLLPNPEKTLIITKISTKQTKMLGRKQLQGTAKTSEQKMLDRKADLFPGRNYMPVSPSKKHILYKIA